MENLRDCPACGSAKQHIWRQVPDHSLSKETFTITECGGCGLLFTNPRPTEAEISRYYEFKEYVSHQDDAPGLVNKAYRIARSWTLSGKMKLLERVRQETGSSNTLLDYGCGTGHFLAAAKERGWSVSGLEVSDTARMQAEKRLSQPIWTNVRQLPLDHRYGVITLWHVLEHVHELQATLSVLINQLAPNGTMLIALPNPESLDAQTYQQDWAALDVPRHLYHFRQQAVAQLLARHGLRIQQTLPMPLDAFYVSWLSEKYIGGNPVRAFWRGLRSNMQAGSNGQWSSLIYVARRD